MGTGTLNKKTYIKVYRQIKTVNYGLSAKKNGGIIHKQKNVDARKNAFSTHRLRFLTFC